jgi:hypothetical protein
MEKTEKRVLKRPPELIRLCNLIVRIDEVWCETDCWSRGWQLPSELVTRVDRRLDELRDELLDVAIRFTGEDDLEPDSVSFWAAAREIGASPPLEAVG